MCKIKTLFLLIFILVTGRLQAQSDLVPGYYISARGDTVRGLINCRNEKRNYQRLIFKREYNSPSEIFSPKDITGYAIDEKEYYEKHFVTGPDGEGFFGFFKVIISGQLSLLRFNSSYFAKDSEGNLHDITLKEVKVEGKIRKDYRGLGVLTHLVRDCPDLTAAHLEIQYKRRNYVELFRQYNACIKAEFNETEPIVIKPHIELGVSIASDVSVLRLGYTYDHNSLDPRLAIAIGGFASIFIPKLDENLRLVVEASYMKYNQYDFFTSQGTNNDLFIDYSCLKLPIYLRYKINRLYLEGGLQNQLILNQEIKWRIESIKDNVIYTSYSEITPLVKSSIGYIAGIGTHFIMFGHIMRPSVRYSHIKSVGLQEGQSHQTLAINLSVQLKN